MYLRPRNLGMDVSALPSYVIVPDCATDTKESKIEETEVAEQAEESEIEETRIAVEKAE